MKGGPHGAHARNDSRDETADEHRTGAFATSRICQCIDRAVTAQIDDSIAPADKDHPYDVLSEVVDIAFESGKHHRRPGAVCRAPLRKELVCHHRDRTPDEHDLEKIEGLDGTFRIHTLHGGSKSVGDDALGGCAGTDESPCLCQSFALVADVDAAQVGPRPLPLLTDCNSTSRSWQPFQPRCLRVTPLSAAAPQRLCRVGCSAAPGRRPLSPAGRRFEAPACRRD